MYDPKGKGGLDEKLETFALEMTAWDRVNIETALRLTIADMVRTISDPLVKEIGQTEYWQGRLQETEKALRAFREIKSI